MFILRIMKFIYRYYILINIIFYFKYEYIYIFKFIIMISLDPREVQKYTDHFYSYNSLEFRK